MVINPGKLCISPPQRGVLKVFEQSLCFCDVRVNSGQYLKKWSSVAEGQVLLQSVLEKTKIFFHEWSLKKTKNNHQDVQKTNYTCLNRINIWLHMSQSFFDICCTVATGGPGYQFSPVARKKKRNSTKGIPGSQDHKISQVTTEDGDIFMVTKKDVYVTYPLSTTKSMVVSNGRPWWVSKSGLKNFLLRWYLNNDIHVITVKYHVIYHVRQISFKSAG